MRLLNAATLQLTQFLDERIRPKYAILSHTWLPDNEEVTYDDLQRYHSALAKGPDERPTVDAIMRRLGFEKIEGCCREAQSNGLDWVWVDTCCINKSSSAELSEAINSMFKWYRNAEICYAYLQDVERSERDTAFRRSRWFTRGWTLQELLAPRRLAFYNLWWQLIGTTTTDHLCEIVSEITSIPIAFLKGAPLKDACVAKKMSWASKRETTRPEDVAYSLLGIFDINMPLLYGEGNRAFMRLQERIIGQTRDDSILAWGEFNLHPTDFADVRFDCGASLGVLATSPKEFQFCGDVQNGIDVFGSKSYSEIQVSTIGVKLEADLWYTSQRRDIGRGHYTPYSFAFCELFCYISRHRPQRIKIILATDSFGQYRPGSIFASVFGTSFSQYARIGRVIWCDLRLNTWSRIFLYPLRLRRGRSLIIAKDPISAMERDPARHNSRFILLEVPRGYKFNIEYVHSNFEVDVYPYRPAQSSLRIWYEPEHTTDSRIGMKPLGLRRVLYYGGSTITYLAAIGFLFGLTLGFLTRLDIRHQPAKTAGFILLLVVIANTLAFGGKLIALVSNKIIIWHTAGKRDLIRACIRLTADQPFLPSRHRNQLLIIIWNRPIILNFLLSFQKHAVPWVSLAPVFILHPERESSHPLGLNERSPMSRQLILGGTTYVPHIIPLKRKTKAKDRGLDIQVVIEVKEATDESRVHTSEDPHIPLQMLPDVQTPSPDAPTTSRGN
ncbi:heterokaryon incompatibility protein-domain-containing protein [Xylaria telfairii]|nr:heterokaryon incompatibility protein-domain-containing protein [Xylaria telfairii]